MVSLAQVSDYTPLKHNANRKYSTTKQNRTGKHNNKPVTYIKNPSDKTVLFTPIRLPLIRARTILASQRKDASSGKPEIRAFDRIKPTSNSQ